MSNLTDEQRDKVIEQAGYDKGYADGLAEGKRETRAYIESMECSYGGRHFCGKCDHHIIGLPQYLWDEG